MLGATVDPGDHRLAHAQGRDQRGAARLGDQRRRHPLPARHGGRPAPVPGDGARLRARHRRRGAARSAWTLTGALPDAVARLRRRRLQRDRHLPRVHPRRRRAAVRLRGRRRRRRHRPARGEHHRRRRPACCTAPARTCCRTRTARPSSRTRSRPAWTTRRSGPEHAWLHDTGRATYEPVDRRRGDGRVPAAVPHRGHHPGDRERARAGRRAAGHPGAGGRAGPRADRRWSTCPAAATRTWRPPASSSGSLRRDERVSVAVREGARRGPGALVGYLPAGFPTVDGGIAAIRAMVEAGVDVVEVGFPYSDPVMDGPVIQRASEIALAGGVRAGRRAAHRRGGRRRRRAGASS